MFIFFSPHNILKIIAFKCMHKFPPHLSRVATLPENSLTDKQTRCFPLGDRWWDDATNWRLTNSNIPWNFKYWLMCLYDAPFWLNIRSSTGSIRAVHGPAMDACFQQPPMISLVTTLHRHHRVARPSVSIAVSTSWRHFERSCARIHDVLRPRLWAEGRALLYGAMSALVDLPGVANPLEDDWWLLEEYASGLVMGRLSQDVRTDEVVSLR